MDAVIFDMDGVIIDSQTIANQLLIAQVQKQDVYLTQEELAQLNGASLGEFWHYVKLKYKLPKPLQFYTDDYPENEEINLYQGTKPISGVTQFLDDLIKNKIPTALATSASRRRMNAVLNLYNLQGKFPVKLCAEDVKQSKPNPEIFLLAAQRLSCNPRQCVVIEDSTRGLMAAKRAGMLCVGYKGLPHIQQDMTQADLIVTDFHQCSYMYLKENLRLDI
jgi:HAD superfamily hydrolase (TIGR01509 family)